MRIRSTFALGLLTLNLLALGLLAAAIVPSAVAAAEHDLKPLKITIDGKPVSQEMSARSAKLRPGEVLVLEFGLILGDERELNFTIEGEQRERVYVESRGLPKRLVGVRISKVRKDSVDVVIDPLSGLNEAEVRGLRGIDVGSWNPSIAAKLREIDPLRCCVSIRDDASTAPTLELPAGLRTLRWEINNSEPLPHLAALQPLKELRYFALDNGVAVPFDCALLKRSSQLEVLDLAGSELKNVSALGTFTELRELDMRFCSDLADVAFAKGMTKLEQLELQQTGVADLTPLAGLPQLRELNADQTPVAKLPVSLPALKTLKLLSTALSEADIEAFKKANPGCTVEHRWLESLQRALAKTTRVRVRTGGTCHRDERREKTLFEITKPEELKQLIAGIGLDDEHNGFHCMCCGEPSLEFYDEHGLQATLGFHHGRSLRWPGGWPSDAALTYDSANFLIDWLAEHGATGPREDRKRAIEEVQARRRKGEQALVGMPPALAAALRKGPEAFDELLAKDPKDSVAQAEIVLRMFGTSNESWTQLDQLDQFAEERIKKFDRATQMAAVERGLKSDDRQLRRGAARFWKSSAESPLGVRQPADSAKLLEIVVTVQMESRYYPQRIAGLTQLSGLRSTFPKEVFDAQLAAGLHDPEPQVRRKAMLVAGETKHAGSAADLLLVLAGKALEVRPLPAVPEWETRDIPPASDDVAKGCSDIEVAALALGRMNHLAAKPAIAALKPATPMTEVALALLGDGDRLQPEHFATPDSNQALQLAAFEAVIRSRGRFGLPMALGYRQATHWWEEERVAVWLAKTINATGAPGSDELVDCKSLKTLREWYDKHGADFQKHVASRPVLGK